MSEFRESEKIKFAHLNEWNPKQFLNPKLNTKIAHQGPQKSKTTPKLCQNQMSKLKETKKMHYMSRGKVVDLMLKSDDEIKRGSFKLNIGVESSKLKVYFQVTIFSAYYPYPLA